jgi:hypothetical protein
LQPLNPNLSTRGDLFMHKSRIAFWLIVLTFATIPAFAADRVISNGIDLWFTQGDGSTFADFSKNPIPAGFFCSKSEPFTGRIGFRGIPVATGAPGELGRTDTIVQRLDDAVFNKRGVAYTRLQVRSLNFESIAPIKTSCGLFNATVSLDGEQPITRMRVIRENKNGGRFEAPIAVNVKISFTPVGRIATEPLEIRKSLRFPPLPNQHWASRPAPGGLQVNGFVLVDTDGDRAPDTYLPGTSNFAVGQAVNRTALPKLILNCHESDDCSHCVR